MTISKYIGDKIKRLNKTRDNIENKIAKIEFNSNDDRLISLINKYDSYTNEINKYEDLKRDLFNMLDTKDIEITRIKLNKIMSNLDEFKGKIKSFIKNRLHDQFMDFNRWKENGRIERTTSKLENAFLKTMPKIFKRKYRTVEGIMAIIYLNEQKWVENQKRRKYYS